MAWPLRYSVLLWVGGGITLLDQLTKVWVVRTMNLYESKPIIPGLLDLHYIQNAGAAFGLFSGSHSGFRIPFFILVSVAAVCIILFLFRKLEESDFLTPLALSMVLGGATGNLVDRIRLGAVVDFILLHYRGFQWPAFNVADIAITAGVFLLVLRMFRPEGGSPARTAP